MSHQTLKEDLKGVEVTPTTPFSEDTAQILYNEYRNNIEFLVDAGIELFIPVGNVGEYYSVTDEERIRIVEETVDVVGSAGSVVGGIGGSTEHAVNLANRYAEVGADGAMIMHPDHTYTHESGIEAYFEEIAERTDIGLILYPKSEEVSITTMANVSVHENIVGVKWGYNNFLHFLEAVERVPGDIVWIDGMAERYAPTFAFEGAEGFTTALANFAPEASLALMDALREKDWERAKEIRAICRPYENIRKEATYGAASVPATKFGMDLAGLYGGPSRAPCVELDENQQSRARDAFDRIMAAEY